MTADRPAPPVEPSTDLAEDDDANYELFTEVYELLRPHMVSSAVVAEKMVDLVREREKAAVAAAGNSDVFRLAVALEDVRRKLATRDAELAKLREQRDQTQDNAEHWADEAGR